MQGGDATLAGSVLIPTLLSWSTISLLASLIVRSFGSRLIVRAGALFLVIGAATTVLFREQTSVAVIALALIPLGIGFGLVSVMYTLAVQRTARREIVGVATASTQFVRMIGGTVGVAIMGAILNGQMQQHFAPIAARLSSSAHILAERTSSVHILLAPGIRTVLPATLLEQLRQAFSESLFWVFVTMLLMALLGLLLILWFPSVPFEPGAPEPEDERETEQSRAVQTQTMKTGAS